MIFDIDYQGTRQVREKLGADVVTVFILPPEHGRAAAPARAPGRGHAARRSSAGWRTPAIEIERWVEYDYVIVNEDLERAPSRP